MTKKEFDIQRALGLIDVNNLASYLFDKDKNRGMLTPNQLGDLEKYAKALKEKLEFNTERHGSKSLNAWNKTHLNKYSNEILDYVRDQLDDC